MNLTYEVPVAVRRVAERTLKLHRSSPLADVCGVRIAEQLTDGRVSVDVVAQMHRFFLVNARATAHEAQSMRSEENSSAVRSYLLHGAEAGQRWAEKLYAQARREGYEPKDATTDLLRLQPDEVYQRFSAGAWRWEYDLDPPKAARFVEAYHYATGLHIELHRAFGDSAAAVGNALHRRLHSPDLFREAARVLEWRDTEHRLAAELDLQEVLHGLDEALSPQIWKGSTSDQQTAKLVWAPFVAYLVLAVERPDLLVDLNKTSLRPPAQNLKPSPYTAYHDSINTYVTWFHPKGSRFDDPAGTKFSALPEELYELMYRAFYGKPLQAVKVQKALGAARRWTAENKKAGSLFHVFNADWKKANWKHILDNIPTDADVRAPFAEFVASNPMPQAGIKLQQTLSDKKTKKVVLAFLKSEGLVKEGFTSLHPVKLRDTKSGKAAAVAKTPLGIYSVGRHAGGSGPEWVCLGSYQTSLGKYLVFVNAKDPVDLIVWSDNELTPMIKSGKFVVTQAHRDMSGSVYGGAQEPEPPVKAGDATPEAPPEDSGEPPSKSLTTIERAVADYAADHDLEFEDFTKILPTGTLLQDVVLAKWEQHLFEGDAFHRESLKDFVGGETITIPAGQWNYLASYKNAKTPGSIIVNVWTTSAESIVAIRDVHDHAAVLEKDLVPMSVWQQAQAGSDLPPKPYTDPFGDSPGGEPGPAPATSTAPDQIEQYDVIEWEGAAYWVVDVQGDGKIPIIMRLAVGVSDESPHPFDPLTTSADLSKSSTELEADVTSVLELGQFVFLYSQGPWTKSNLEGEAEPWSSLSPGAQMPDPSDGVFIQGYYRDEPGGSVPYALAARDDTMGFEENVSFWRFHLVAIADQVVVEQTYDPPPKEESEYADGGDPEAGDFEMCGTQQAVDWLTDRGWTPAIPSMKPSSYVWGLGEVRTYKGGMTRAIVGYGANDKGVPVYVIVTEKGNMNWVACTNGHKKYGAVIEIDQSVVDKLVPLPGAKAKQAFPKVKYPLSRQAKDIAKEQGFTFVNPPSNRLFHVGTRLQFIGGVGASDRVLLGWVDFAGKPKALLGYPDGVQSPKSYITTTSALLAEEWVVAYQTETKVFEDAFDIGKADDALQTITIPSTATTLPSTELPVGWDDPPAIEQPPMAALPATHKRVSAGIVCIVPPGSSVSLKNGDAITTLHYTVILTKPIGKFMGYKYLFPKGTVGKDEGLTKAAVREVYEETGLTVRPVAFLGDYKGVQAVTRMFIGFVTGGNPTKKNKPEETDAVVGRAFTAVGPVVGGGFEPVGDWFDDLIPAGNADIKWQQKCLQDVFDWIQANGPPHMKLPQSTTQDSVVTAPGDSAAAVAAAPKGTFADPFSDDAIEEKASNTDEEGHEKNQWLPASTGIGTGVKGPAVGPTPTKWSPTIPASQVYATDVWKTLLFKCPFPMTSSMVQVLKSKAKAHGITPTSFDVARSRSAGPKFAESFETHAGTPYTAAGYVSWLADDGDVYHYLLAATPGGEIEALPSEPNGFESAHISKDQTFANASQDAWFTHPDPAINKIIQDAFETGVLPKGTKMQTFKVKWLKDAGVPAYAVVTKNLLRDVCSMFVPGACSQFQYDAIVASLKARMQATHSGKKKKGAQTTTKVASEGSVASPPTPEPFSAGVPPAPTKKKVIPTGVFSPVHRQYVNNPQPHLFEKVAGGAPGGSKPNMFIRGPGGTKWLAKYAHGEDFRSEIDAVAYRLSEAVMPPGTVVPVGVMDFDGKRVSFQPFAEGATNPPNVDDLDDENKTTLLSQHAYDMFAGDHDGHKGNWLSVSGKLVAIDRGQSFKFVLMGKEESLDPHWHAPGNFGDGYAKRLLIRWSKKEVEIPEMAWATMLGVIRNITKLTPGEIGAYLAPVFASLNTGETDQQRIVNALAKRAKNYEKDWTAVLKKLRKDFKWPSAPKSVPKPKFGSSPVEMKFGQREERAIADAVSAGWKGKSVRVDKDGIEGQEVMVKRVTWTQKAGQKVPATLMHWRVGRPAGLKAAKKLYSAKGTEFNDDAGGPHRLKIDTQNGYWEKIWAAIKSVNYHLGKQNDLDINMTTVGACTALVPQLTELTELTVTAGGEYAPTHEPNEAVFAMAEQYLQYINILQYWVDNKEELLGQHSPTFAEFLWEEPPEEKPDEPEAPPYKVSVKGQGAVWPKCVVTNAKIHVDNLNKPQYNSSLQSQFVIEDPLTGAKIYWNPPGGVDAAGIKKGVETQKGQAWAIIPGEPSPATVAHIMKLFQDASGINMTAATDEDAEAMYWSRQAAALQNGGAPNPDANSEIVREEPYAAALSKYQGGDAAGAIADLKKIVAKKLGMTVAAVAKEAAPHIDGLYDAGGAGFHRQLRIGWDRARLQEVLGPNCHVAHHLSETPLAWMQAMRNNGALLSNVIKPYYGVTKTGASPGADMQAGGGQGLFCCFRDGFTSTSGMIYFDISLALRLDVYIVGTGDTYGNTQKQRYMTPEQWVKLGAHKGTGPCGASSPRQVSIRHDIDLQQYLVRVVAGSQAAECIKVANDLGWTFYGGAPPEKVFV